MKKGIKMIVTTSNKQRREMCDLCCRYDTDLFDPEYREIYVHSTKNYPLKAGYIVSVREWTVADIVAWKTEHPLDVYDLAPGTQCSMSDWNTLEHICPNCFDFYFKAISISTKNIIDGLKAWK